jgi:hypothetical protein
MGVGLPKLDYIQTDLGVFVGSLRIRRKKTMLLVIELGMSAYYVACH